MKRVLPRLLVSLLVAGCIGWTLHWALLKLDRPEAGPAGFGQGMVHGALMPLSLPNLLLGDDVSIYAVVNTGRVYKIGYICGVNICGLVFFGYFFWRARRLRHHLRQAK